MTNYNGNSNYNTTATAATTKRCKETSEGGGTLLTDHAVKEWLSRYADAAREVALLRARADAIRDRVASPSSPTLDGLPRSPGFEGDKLGGIIGAADALDREAAEKEQDVAALYNEIDEAIRKIGGKHGVERRTVLQCRYLDTMAWQDVAYLVFGDRTDYSDKFDSFQRRVFNIHKAALEDLAQILYQSEGDRKTGNQKETEK